MRRIICITGNGKGKTTSAIGMYIRALGNGYKAKFYQFLKSNENCGENKFFNNNEKIELLGYIRRSNFNYDENDALAAKNGFIKIVDEAKNYDFVFIDELSYPINWGWVILDEAINLIKSNPKVHFVFTGRDMPNELVELADTVSEIKEIKHAYNKSNHAQKGIEF